MFIPLKTQNRYAHILLCAIQKRKYFSFSNFRRNVNQFCNPLGQCAGRLS